MKFSKEFKIGFLFILATALLVWGYSFLKNRNILYKERILYAVYKNVSGLQPSSPVYINGVKVGQVGKVEFDPTLNGDIIVKFEFSHTFPIQKNSTAKIFSEDLMGTKAVEIILGSGSDFTKSGDTLRTDVEASLKDAVNQQILPLKLKAEDLLSSIDTMVVAVHGIFNKESLADLNASIKSIRHTFTNLESTTQNIDTLVTTQSGRLASILYNIDMITRNISNNGQAINRIFDNVATLTDTLARSNISGTLNKLNKAVDDFSAIASKINNGEGTLGMLVKDDKLYKDLQKSSEDLNLLLEDIRLNPKRYVRVSVF